MAVNTITAFQTAVGALAPASGNKYTFTYAPQNPNGTYNGTLKKNGVNFLSQFTYNGAWSSEGTSDANPSGASVSFVSPDGIEATADAQQWLNSLA